MVAPLIAAAGIAAVSGLAQAYAAEKARGGNSRKMDEIKRMFEAIVPPDYDVSINDPPEYIKERLPPAALDFSRITPEDYKVMGTYAPEAAQYVAEANPTLVEGSAAAKEGRGAQIDALRQFQKVSKGESPELKIKMEEAARNAQIASQSRQASALQDAQRRGTASGGLSFASALQGTSDSMLSGAQQSQMAALQAYKDKLAATQTSGQMGRQLAQDELGQESQNAGIINDFNQRTSRAYQASQDQRAALANQAQMYNLGQAQDVANRNTGLANDAQRYNLENKNKLTQQAYNNTANERNYQNTLAENQAQWSAQEKARQNNLKTQTFGNQLQRANGMAGIGAQEIGMNSQNAADKNAMIGGVANAASGYFQGQASAEAQKAAQDAENARWDKYYAARYPQSSSTWDDKEKEKYGGLA